MSVPILRPPVDEPLHDKDWVRPAGNHEFRVTQHFSDRNVADTRYIHGGTDMGSKQMPGRKVYAPAAGTIIAEGWLLAPWSEATTATLKARWNGSPNWGGIMAVVRLSDDCIWAASHLIDTVVSRGQQVKAGQLIGHVGNTGAAYQYGTHLHNDLYVRVPSSTPLGYLVIAYAGARWQRVDMEPHLAQNQVPDTSISSEDDPVFTFGGAAFGVERSVPRYHLVANANFRVGPSTKTDSIKVMPKGTVVPVAYWVDGESIGGDDQWAIAWLYDGQYRMGFFHRSVLGAPDEAAADCSEAVRTATAPLSAEITALRAKAAEKDAYIAKYPKG